MSKIRLCPYVGLDRLLEGIGWNRIYYHAQDWLTAVQTFVLLFYSEQSIQQRFTLEVIDILLFQEGLLLQRKSRASPFGLKPILVAAAIRQDTYPLATGFW